MALKKSQLSVRDVLCDSLMGLSLHDMFRGLIKSPSLTRLIRAKGPVIGVLLLNHVDVSCTGGILNEEAAHLRAFSLSYFNLLKDIIGVVRAKDRRPRKANCLRLCKL